MFAKLRELFPGQGVLIEPGETPQPVASRVRVEPHPLPLRLDLGERQLSLRCEQSADTSPRPEPPCWRLEEATPSADTPRGSARLHPEEVLVLGRDDARARVLFDLPGSSPRRQLELRNKAGSLVLRNLAPDHHCSLSTAREWDVGGPAGPSRWYDRLEQLRGLLGSFPEMLEPQEALDAVVGVVEILRNEAHRAKDRMGRPGGLLELPGDPTPLILGDLHGRLDNLLRVLCEDRWLEALLSGRAYLLLLGDTVHRETAGELDEMDSSLLMLDCLCKLKRLLPDRFFWLRGNHESFDDRVGKGGVPQGLLLRAEARTVRGDAYADALETLFRSLPYLACTDDFIACHAGAPLHKVNRSDLVAIHDHPDLADELLWVRPSHPSRPGGFGKRDVARLRESLARPASTPLIVGHTPQSDEGVLWSHVAEIPDFHVIYDARTHGVPAFTRLRGEMVCLEYSFEPLLEIARSTI